MTWRQFVMDLEALPPDAVEALFARHGAEAVTFSDGGDDAVLEPERGETPLWLETQVTGLFPADADFTALVADLGQAFGLREPPRHRIEELADREWEREWLRDFRPMRFGRRLWVCPHGEAADDPDGVVVALDPGLAFGTGTHPTTALCLRWLDDIDLDGLTVLDFGCGSGILGIAALKLGASSVVAIDHDPQAVTAARANAGHNEVGDRIRVDSALPDGTFDVVLANILAQPLIDHADWLTARLAPGASLALSGILAFQAESVRAAYAASVRFEPTASDDGWIRLSGRKR